MEYITEHAVPLICLDKDFRHPLAEQFEEIDEDGDLVRSYNEWGLASVLTYMFCKRVETKRQYANIEMVIVNLYPFKKYLNSSNKKKAIEMIDIGGTSLIRAASKNYKFITTICNISDYQKLISNLNKNNGETDVKFRKRMAKKTFKLTSEYDKLIFEWFNENK